MTGNLKLRGGLEQSVVLLVVSLHITGIQSCSMPTRGEESDNICDLLHHLKWTRFVIQRVLTPCLVIGGILGNLINIAVLTQKSMRHSSTNIYLSVLALFDILYLLFAFTMSLKHYDSIVNTNAYIRYNKPIGKPLVDTFSNTTVWLTLTFTIERYIGVCHPMKGKKWCTAKRAQIVTLIVCIASAVITFPEFFEYHVVREVIGDFANGTTETSLLVVTRSSRTALFPERTSFGKLPSYQWGYVHMNQALFTFLPLVVLIVFNVLLVRAVVDAAHRRKFLTGLVVLRNTKQEKQNKEQQKITIMLISVVIVFLICQMPQAIMNLFITYLKVAQTSDARTMLVITILNNVFNLLVLLNSALNFILYSCFSTKYRQTCKTLFCECLPQQIKLKLFKQDTHRPSISMATRLTYLSSRRYTMPAVCENRSSPQLGSTLGASLSKSSLFFGNRRQSNIMTATTYSGGKLGGNLSKSSTLYVDSRGSYTMRSNSTAML